jgi:hypothetical protein
MVPFVSSQLTTVHAPHEFWYVGLTSTTRSTHWFRFQTQNVQKNRLDSGSVLGRQRDVIAAAVANRVPDFFIPFRFELAIGDNAVMR